MGGSIQLLAAGQSDRASPEHAALAARLRDAYSIGAIPPLREWLDAGDVTGAYAVQALNARHWVEAGRHPVGWKIGLTSAAVQRQLGVDQPDYGILFRDMGVASGDALPAGRLLQPRAEAEVAIVLAADLDSPDTTRADVEAATDYALAAIEIVDSRIADWAITLADTVADNASSGLYVLGNVRRHAKDIDLSSLNMELRINGALKSSGVGAACGDPFEATAWLARTLTATGTPLRAGDLILTGALGPMVPIAPGDVVEATVGGLGSVGFSY